MFPWSFIYPLLGLAFWYTTAGIRHRARHRRLSGR